MTVPGRTSPQGNRTSSGRRSGRCSHGGSSYRTQRVSREFWHELLLAFLCSILGAIGSRLIHWFFDEDEEEPKEQEVDCPMCQGSGTIKVRCSKTT